MKIERPIYNLVQKRFEINGEFEPKIELSVLKYGWGIVNSSTLAKNSKEINPEEYLTAEIASKESHIGIFSKNT